MGVAKLSRRLALVIGVNGQPVPGRATLKYAVNDGQDMAQLLQKDCCGFELFYPPLLGEQATTSQVRDMVLDLADHLQEEDFALFFFSGHAEVMLVEADLDDVFLVTHDFNAARVKRDRNAHLSLRWLRRMLFEHEKARSILIILDCCYAGKFSDSAHNHYLDELQQRLQYYFAEPGMQSPSRPGGIRLALTATGAGTSKEEDGHGLLTSYILPALRGDCEQAANEQGQVTFTSLFDYLDHIMPADQRPHFFGAGSRLILATHPDLSVQKRREREQEARRAEREQRLRAMFADHRGFLQNRLESFVGRERELVEIRQRIDVLLPTGGYLTITGQAGQGKSSVIAKLIEEASREQSILECVAYHFIPLTPPPDYQVALLRNLMARLILKYGLSDLFLASESRAALSEAFPIVLKEIAEKNGQEIIFIDGLDQLVADQQTGLRDLSFLPQGPGNPPQGIVFVLGTRPNDTLRPLELLKPYNEYKLPNLSRADFDQILQHRGVILKRALADKFYETLEENALYLDLVAKELAGWININNQEVEAIIRQIADNPENLFSLTIDRLRWQEKLWTEVIKPVFGLLLVTNEPLSREHLKHLLNLDIRTNVDGEQFNQGLEKLGGLVVIDDQQRYSLFHLKFRDHLRQDKQRPNKKYVFDTEDEQCWHQRFIAWCEQNGLVRVWDDAISDIVEQRRRRYARQHYIAHLYHARDWNKLFSVLDEGAYGKSKVQHDPSMRTYALDLDLGREAVATIQWSLEEAIQHLPHLWRYTLLRCTLASRADNYPKEAFKLMLILEQEIKALGLAELLTSLAYKAQIFTLIASHLATQAEQEREAMQMFSRAERVIHSISDEGSKARVLAELGTALGQAGHWQEAERVIRSISNEENKARTLAELGTALGQAGHWQEAERVIRSITYEKNEAEALAGLATALGQAGSWQEAVQLWEEAVRIINSISDEESKAEALTKLGTVLGQVGRWQEAEWAWDKAEQAINSIPYEESEAEALAELSTALGQVGKWEEAERVIRSIPYGKSKAKALARLTTALGQAEHWEQAERVIRSISYEESHTEALVGLATALGKAERWDESARLIRSISDKESEAKALAELGIALRQAGYWEQAKQVWEDLERMIRSIPYEESHIEALVGLGAALGQARNWKEAERITRSISDRESRARALAGLATALGQAGHWKEAEHIIGSIFYETSKAEALTELATALEQAGHWTEAERVISSISDDNSKAEALAELAAALRQAKLWTEAERVISSIPYEKSKGEALTELATALGQAEHRKEAARVWKVAERVIRSLSDQESKAEALTELATAIKQAGYREEAVRVWEEAELVIRSLSHEENVVEALTELVIVLKQAGRWKEAELVIRSLSHREDKANALIELATALVQAGRWEAADRVIHSIPDEESRAGALAGLATALGQAGRWKEAEQVIGSILYNSNRAEALANLAETLAQRDEYSHIVSLVQREWLRAASREEALHLLPCAFGLIPYYPGLGTALYDAFAWVDRFLQG